MIYVVGSGPAGVSCAQALLQQGLEVTMLDAGLDLEPEREAVVQRLASTRPEEWSTDDLDSMRENMEPTSQGIPTKRVYGSDFPYREVRDYVPIEWDGVEGATSLARGGFSNVWGAVVAPFPDEDIADWPISSSELAPHYEAVFGFMSLAAQQDGLASLLPIHARHPEALRPSLQAEAFLRDTERSHRALEDAGIHIGRARLAVRATPGETDAGCVYCGLCLYGCPYGLIYNTRSTLASLDADPGFRYQTDVVVSKLVESKKGVRIFGRSRVDRSALQLEGERVYLACGVYATTRIVLESLEAHERPITIRDSQYFLLPLLRYRATAGVESEPLHTLAQVFVEIRDAEVSEHTVHLEMFTYNDLLSRAAESRLGPLAPLFRLPLRELVRRVMVGQCFLHSNVSPTIRARLVRRRDKEASTLVLEGRPHPETRHVVGRVWRKLWAHRGQLRAIPLPPLIQITRPGRGFHSGGSFPMRAAPVELESDLWGRPHGLDRVHIVDASVFPTIPATTITLPVMANAHRIASGYFET